MNSITDHRMVQARQVLQYCYWSGEILNIISLFLEFHSLAVEFNHNQVQNQLKIKV